jgi:hypothetical protein
MNGQLMSTPARSEQSCAQLDARLRALGARRGGRNDNSQYMSELTARRNGKLDQLSFNTEQRRATLTATELLEGHESASDESGTTVHGGLEDELGALDHRPALLESLSDGDDLAESPDLDLECLLRNARVDHSHRLASGILAALNHVVARRLRKPVTVESEASVSSRLIREIEGANGSHEGGLTGGGDNGNGKESAPSTPEGHPCTHTVRDDLSTCNHQTGKARKGQHE